MTATLSRPSWMSRGDVSLARLLFALPRWEAPAGARAFIPPPAGARCSVSASDSRLIVTGGRGPARPPSFWLAGSSGTGGPARRELEMLPGIKPSPWLATTLRWSDRSGSDLLGTVSRLFHPLDYFTFAQSDYTTRRYLERDWLVAPLSPLDVLERQAVYRRLTASDETLLDRFAGQYGSYDRPGHKKTNVFGYVAEDLRDEGGYVQGLFYSPIGFLTGVVGLRRFWEGGETGFEREMAGLVRAFEEATFIGDLRQILASPDLIDIRDARGRGGVESICKRTAGLLGSHRDIVDGLYRALREFDTIVMWRRFFEEAEGKGWGHCFPALSTTPRFEMTDLRNLGLAIQEETGPDSRKRVLVVAEEVIPSDVRLDPERPVILITGGNGNGKTHLLEACANAVVQFYRGLPVLAASGSLSPIGTLEMNVNVSRHTLTASAFQNEVLRLMEVFEAVEQARSQGLPALVLMDEPVRGTSRLDGYALLAGLIAGCVARGAFVVGTTHYNAIGRWLADPRVGIGTIGLDHRLREGAGESGAIELAKRTGFPEEITDEARSNLDQARAGGRIEVAPLPERTSGPVRGGHFTVSPRDALELGILADADQARRIGGGYVDIGDTVYTWGLERDYIRLGPAGLEAAEHSPIVREQSKTPLFVTGAARRSERGERPRREGPFKDRIDDIPPPVQHHTVVGLTRAATEEEGRGRHEVIRAIAAADDAAFTAVEEAVGFGFYWNSFFPFTPGKEAPSGTAALAGMTVGSYDPRDAGKMEESLETACQMALSDFIGVRFPEIAGYESAPPALDPAKFEAISRCLDRLSGALAPFGQLSMVGGYRDRLDELMRDPSVVAVMEKWKEWLGDSPLEQSFVDLSFGAGDPGGKFGRWRVEGRHIEGKIREEWTSFRRLCTSASEQLAEIYRIFLHLNFLAGCARMAREGKITPVAEGPVIDLSGSRSPVLLGDLPADRVTPLDWNRLDFEGEPVVILTGTNGGGKSQAALHLANNLVTARQTGYMTGDKASAPPVGRIIARIETAGHTGTASSFTNELERLLQVLKELETDGGAGTCVFLDEPFKGTAGEEAAALQIAYLRHLVRKGVKVVLTTNYTEIFECLDRMPDGTLPHRALNVEFFGDDRYHLREGRGRSSGIDVAESMGLPADVIAHARATARAMEAGNPGLLPELPPFPLGDHLD